MSRGDDRMFTVDRLQWRKTDTDTRVVSTTNTDADGIQLIRNRVSDMNRSRGRLTNLEV